MQAIQTLKAFLAGLGIGAGTMYFLDPDRGRDRRTAVRDRAHRMRTAATRAVRDVEDRAYDLMDRAGDAIAPGDISDRVLAERVRARIGRVVTHPSALAAEVVDGLVIIGGYVLAEEAEALLDAVAGIRGVRQIQDLLEAVADPADFPELQEVEESYDVARRAPRLLTGAAGATVALLGARRRGWTRLPLAVAGGALLIRSLLDRHGEELTEGTAALRDLR